jgi:hypothetical protein
MGMVSINRMEMGMVRVDGIEIGMVSIDRMEMGMVSFDRMEMGAYIPWIWNPVILTLNRSNGAVVMTDLLGVYASGRIEGPPGNRVVR